MTKLCRSIKNKFLCSLVCVRPCLLAQSNTAVLRKGVTLAGPLSYFTANNFAALQAILDTNAGVIGVNLPWNAATADCSDSNCSAQRPLKPTSWNDIQYANSPAVQVVDEMTEYIAQHGHGAIVMGITYGTPGWAACPADPTDPAKQPYYPPANAADYGNFMYAMSERYSGTHTNRRGAAIGKIRDWVVYNEVNSPAWWGSTACNTQHYDPVYYYGAFLMRHTPRYIIYLGGLMFESWRALLRPMTGKTITGPLACVSLQAIQIGRRILRTAT